MTVSTARHAAPTPTRPRIGYAALVVGVVLFGMGLLVGGVVTVVGPRATGELALDVTLSHHRDALLNALSWLVDIGFGPVVAPLLLIVVGVVVWFRNRPAALTLLIVTIVGWLSVGVGKFIFARSRPPAALVHTLATETGLDSFPSGHVAFAAALVGGAVLALRVAGRPIALAVLIGIPLVIIVAALRLYSGAHYLGDVVAAPLFTTGTVFGISALALPALSWLAILLRLPWLRDRHTSSTANADGEPATVK